MNMTTFRKKCFDPHPRDRGCVRTEYVIAWCYILHSLYFDMQGVYFQIFFLTFDPSPGVNVVSIGKIFATMLMHASFPII